MEILWLVPWPREALRVITDENLVQNSAELGAYFLRRLREIKSPHIKELRGRGLFIGIELKPEAGGARKFCEALKGRGMLCKETHEHVIRIAPPLVIKQEEIDWAVDQVQSRSPLGRLQTMDCGPGLGQIVEKKKSLASCVSESNPVDHVRIVYPVNMRNTVRLVLIIFLGLLILLNYDSIRVLNIALSFLNRDLGSTLGAHRARNFFKSKQEDTHILAEFQRVGELPTHSNGCL